MNATTFDHFRHTRDLWKYRHNTTVLLRRYRVWSIDNV